MKQHLLKPIESAINFALGLDEASQEKLLELDGYLFEICFTSPQFSVFATVAEQHGKVRMILTDQAQTQADVTISGTAAAFINLMQQGMGMSAMSRNAIRIHGDVEAGQRIQRIIEQLDLDWEGLIAKHFGDMAAHKVGIVMRDVLNWAKQTNQYTQENIVDYFAHEKRMVLTQDEFDIMADELDELRASVDRLQARIQQVSNQMRQQ